MSHSASAVASSDAHGTCGTGHLPNPSVLQCLTLFLSLTHELLRKNRDKALVDELSDGYFSYLVSRDLDQCLLTAETCPNDSCIGVYREYYARNEIVRLRALRAPATT